MAIEKEQVCDCNSIHEEVVCDIQNNMLADAEIASISALFKVLGDPTRAKIVMALDRREVCVCDLAVALNMTKSAISHQLALLRTNKIVKSRRDGKHVYYSLDDEHVTDVIELVQAHVEHVCKEDLRR